MAYATIEDIGYYTGINEVDLPGDIDRLIDRADDVIDFYSKQPIDTDKELHATAAKKAVSAQIEYWLNVGEDVDAMEINQFSIGSFSMSNSNEQFKKLAPRAYRYLQQAGLMYTGKSAKSTLTSIDYRRDKS